MVRIYLPCAWWHHEQKDSIIDGPHCMFYFASVICILWKYWGQRFNFFLHRTCFFFNFCKDLTKPFFSSKKLVQVLGSSSNASSGGMEDPLEKVVYVLTSNSFQKWILSQDEPDKMFYNCDLETCAKQAFATHLWFQENPDPEWIKVWLVSFIVHI